MKLLQAARYNHLRVPDRKGYPIGMGDLVGIMSGQKGLKRNKGFVCGEDKDGFVAVYMTPPKPGMKPEYEIRNFHPSDLEVLAAVKMPYPLSFNPKKIAQEMMTVPLTPWKVSV